MPVAVGCTALPSLRSGITCRCKVLSRAKMSHATAFSKLMGNRRSGQCDCNGTLIDALGVCGGNCAADLNANGLCEDIEASLCGSGTYWDADESLCLSADNCPSDIDGNGYVAMGDLLIFLSDFTNECEPLGGAPGFSCGEETSHDGYSYSTVVIGEQCWFQENLRSEHYLNGDAIPGELSDVEWVGMSSGAQAVYNNDVANLAAYGRLYNWYAVDDVRGLCPSGWHVPSDEDFNTLELHLGMPASEVDDTGWRGGAQNVGGKLKEAGTTHWDLPNEGADNSSGFTALGGGIAAAYTAEYTDSLRTTASFWSSSPNSERAWYRKVYSCYPDVDRSYDDVFRGFSVRCLRD
jgi:uncharacterized protein (TIGR02145 family)